MVEGKWYRVTDPLNPLCGCDVKLGGNGITNVQMKDGVTQEVEHYNRVIALRRVDVFVGDRPFQLVAPEGEHLGVMVDMRHVEISPLQDETVETGTDRPHGLCLDESEMTRKDGLTIRIARYEKATQIALEDGEGNLLATRTEIASFRDTWERQILAMWETGQEQDDIVYALENN